MRIVRWCVWAMILTLVCSSLVFADSVSFKNFSDKNASGAYIKTTGSGTDTDPVTVWQVIVNGGANGDWVCLYDGNKTSATQKPLIDIVVSANTTQTVSFPRGLVFDRDVDVDVGTSTTSVMTVYSR